MNTVAVALHSINRRSYTERRRFRPNALNLRHLGIRGRRQECRRGNDQYCTDWYETRFLFMSVTLVLLCSMDTAATLLLIENGAYEVNAVMASLISIGQQHFIKTKIALTALCVFLLVVYRNFYIGGLIRISRFVVVFLGIYTTLVTYEIALLIGCGRIIICHT